MPDKVSKEHEVRRVKSFIIKAFGKSYDCRKYVWGSIQETAIGTEK